jgi:hypothetical protein
MTFGPFEMAGFGFLGMGISFALGRAWSAAETLRVKRALKRSRRLTKRARDQRDGLVERLAAEVIDAESAVVRRAA